MSAACAVLTAILRRSATPALQIGKTTTLAPVDKLSLALVAVFAIASLAERPSLCERAGIGMVAGGVLLLAVKR